RTDDDAVGGRERSLCLSRAAANARPQGPEAEVPGGRFRVSLVAREPAIVDCRLHDRVYVLPARTQVDVRVLSDAVYALLEFVRESRGYVDRGDCRQRRTVAQCVLPARDSADSHRAVQSRAVPADDRHLPATHAVVVPRPALLADAGISLFHRVAGVVHDG